MGTPHIDVAIVVRDAEACLPFYRDVLELPPVVDFDLPGGTHMWQLAVGTSVVKLVTHTRTPEAANPPGGSLGGTGLRYWTMGVDDIEDPEGNVVELLERKG